MTTEARKTSYTTGEVARLCQVTKRTVIKWIDGGKLKGYTIPAPATAAWRPKAFRSS